MDKKRYIRKARELLGTVRPEELEQLGLIPAGGRFSPSIHYPPIEEFPPMTEDEYFTTFKGAPEDLFVVYAHIPFCLKRCVFCHFAITTDNSPGEKEHYLDVIRQEMDLVTRRMGIDRIRARSILVGGGTPTDLSPPQVDEFLAFFTERLDLGSCSQFSYDVDPSTLLGKEGAERLRILRSYGVDRITIGIQSFHDDVLKKMNRAHDSKEALEAIRQCRRAGFDNICIELIYGYPGQTIDEWIEDMLTAVSTDVEEIQLYRLRIAPYGPHAGFILQQFRKKPGEFLSLEDVRLMKALGVVISNDHAYNENLTRVFAKDPKYLSRYARDFSCLMHDLVGFGLSSWSGHDKTIGWNVREDLRKYYSMVESGAVPIVEGAVRTEDENRRRCLTMPLKCWGKVMKKVYLDRAGADIGSIFRGKIDRLKEHGLLSEDEEKIELTSRGRFVADEVCQFFYHPDHVPYSEDNYADGELNPYR